MADIVKDVVTKAGELQVVQVTDGGGHVFIQILGEDARARSTQRVVEQAMLERATAHAVFEALGKVLGRTVGEARRE